MLWLNDNRAPEAKNENLLRMQKIKFLVKLFSLTFLKESKQRTFVRNFVSLLCVGAEWLLWLNDNRAPKAKNENLLRVQKIKFLVKLFSKSLQVWTESTK